MKLALALVLLLLGSAAAGVTAARADVITPNLTVHRLEIGQTTEQAGAHPDVSMLFRFCGDGPKIIAATNTAPIVITTESPVDLLTGGRREGIIRYAEGNTAVNGQWGIDPEPGDTARDQVRTHGDGRDRRRRVRSGQRKPARRPGVRLRERRSERAHQGLHAAAPAGFPREPHGAGRLPARPVEGRFVPVRGAGRPLVAQHRHR